MWTSRTALEVTFALCGEEKKGKLSQEGNSFSVYPLRETEKLITHVGAT